MPLRDGTRLGPYEVLSPLGAGGMGEVYRARDTRLDRTVAIKIIPAHLAAEAEVRQRFEREARAVSSLNHPHICTLHDVGVEGTTHYLVMEHLEGETLAARLEHGPLESGALLAVAIQIADALAAAHRAGLVHRDLKPGNIMLTRTGAKLLDFGLARAAGIGTGAPGDLTQSPTLSRPLTAAGSIVGTFQYMAPEQLEGSEADARTDIFAFGAVLYEMATGKRAFDGRTQASLIAAILKEEPRAMTELMPLTPPALEHVVKRCLAKDPDDRWQNARDIMLELMWVRDAGSRAGIPAPVAAHRRHTARAAWIVAGVFAIAAALLGARAVTRAPAQADEFAFQVVPPMHHTFQYSQAAVALSPDGRMLASIVVDTMGAPSLWVRSMDEIGGAPVRGTGNAFGVFWSFDGRDIAYFADGKLKRVALDGGSQQTIADAPDPRGGSWGSAGEIVFQPAASGPLYRISATGGTASAVTVVDTARGEASHRFPCFLPDGRRFLYVVLPAVDGLHQVRVGSLDGGEPVTVARAFGSAVYAEPGYILYQRDDTIVAQRFDPGSLEVSGDPVPIGHQAGASGSLSGAPCAAVARNGTLARFDGDYPDTEIRWGDRSGRFTGARVQLPPGCYIDLSPSPDGQRLATAQWGFFGSHVWMVDLDRNAGTRLTDSPAENFQVRWSPDGSEIVFTSNRDGREKLYIKPADGSRAEEEVLDSGELFTKAEAWVPDGSGIVYHVLTEKTKTDLWLLPLTGDRTPVPLLNQRYFESSAVFSPDGRWMAYLSDESGRSDVYVRAFPSMSERRLVSSDARGAWGGALGFVIYWSEDGREIAYLSGDGRTIMSVRVDPGARFASEAPQALFRTPDTSFNTAFMPDFQRTLFVVPDRGGVPATITVVTDWTRGLERR